MQAAGAVALDVQREKPSHICCLAHVKAGIGEFLRPPVPIFDLNELLSWTLEHNVSIGAQQRGSLPKPPKCVYARVTGKVDRSTDEDLIYAAN